MDKINSFLAAHPNARSALRVFVYTFLASFVPAVLGFLNDLLEWTDGGSFPAVDTLGKAVVAAVVGAIAAGIAFVYNALPIGASSSYSQADPPAVAPNFPDEFA